MPKRRCALPKAPPGSLADYSRRAGALKAVRVDDHVIQQLIIDAGAEVGFGISLAPAVFLFYKVGVADYSERQNACQWRARET